MTVSGPKPGLPGAVLHPSAASQLAQVGKISLRGRRIRARHSYRGFTWIICTCFAQTRLPKTCFRHRRTRAGSSTAGCPLCIGYSV